jgi:hypothetical protein
LARGRGPPTAHSCGASVKWNVCCYGNCVAFVYGAINLKSNQILHILIPVDVQNFGKNYV